MNGVIRNLVLDRGFGFITGEDNKDYFFHHSALQNGHYFRHLENGVRVTFEPTKGSKGLRAENVEVV